MRSGTILYLRVRYHAPSSEHGCCNVYPIGPDGKPLQADWVLRKDGYDKQVTTVDVRAVLTVADLKRAAARLAVEDGR